MSRSETPPKSSTAGSAESDNRSDELRVIQMILGQFYIRTDDPQVRAIEATSWRRVLTGCTADEILAAWEDYQARDPRSETGALRKPTAHQLRQLVMRRRAAENPAPRLAAPSPAEQRAAAAANRVSAEDAASILEAAGFTPRRFAYAEQLRMATSFNAADAPMPATRPEHDESQAMPDDQSRKIRDERPRR